MIVCKSGNKLVLNILNFMTFDFIMNSALLKSTGKSSSLTEALIVSADIMHSIQCEGQKVDLPVTDILVLELGHYHAAPN